MSIDEPVILSVETATRSGSVCVTRGRRLLAQLEGDPGTSQSNILIEQIDRVLNAAGTPLRAIDLFAVALGPGSFTGLRIGLATVKSFAATLERQCIGIQTLHAIAYGAGASPLTIAALPAGRGEVYAQQLLVSELGDVSSTEGPMHVAPAELLDKVAHEPVINWAGNGARAYSEEIRERAESKNIPYHLSDRAVAAISGAHQWSLVINTQPLAVSIAQLALAQAQSGQAAVADDLRAIYVRPSDAELNERC